MGLETADDINSVSSSMMAMMMNTGNIPKPDIIPSDSSRYTEAPTLSTFGVWSDHTPAFRPDLLASDPFMRSTEAPTLSMVNGVWVDCRLVFKPKFKDIATSIYKADTRTLDFVNEPDEVVKGVNAWAEKETKGLIKEILSCLSRDTNLILANALYFKGSWLKPFKKQSTGEENFYLLNGVTAKVPFMVTSGSQYYRVFDDYKLLRLPYQGFHGDKTRAFSMYIFLPKERSGLENFLEKINSDTSLLYEKCAERRTLSKIMVPKFKFSFEFKVSDVMQGMGIHLSFKELDMVDTVLVEDRNKGHVSEIVQMSYIEVDEAGTEAAAVTYTAVLGASLYMPPPPPPEEFVAEYPFLFLVKEDVSGTILFSGVVLNPFTG